MIPTLEKGIFLSDAVTITGGEDLTIFQCSCYFPSMILLFIESGIMFITPLLYVEGNQSRALVQYCENSYYTTLILIIITTNKNTVIYMTTCYLVNMLPSS